MSKLKQLAGETILYGLGSMLPRVLNFLLVPLHTINMFSKAEYGVITKLFAFVAVVNIVYMFGMETAFFRFATKAKADVKRIFNLTQTTVIIISGTLSALFIVFAQSIATALGIPEHPEFIIWLTALMLIDALVAIPFARLRLEKKAFLFAAIKIANVILLIALNFYFLKIAYDPSVGVGYVILANLIANALFVLLFIKVLIAWRPAWDKQITPQLFSYAYPVMLTGVAGMINEMFSRTMLDWWLPKDFYPGQSQEDAMGIFGACYKFAVFMNLGIQAFRYAAEPFFFSNASDKNSPALFAKINHFFIIVCCIVLVGISINLDILKYFIGSDFQTGLEIVPVLLLAYLFLGVYYNLSVWFKLTDKTHYGTIISFIGVVITVAGNYFLIPIAGFMGSSLAAFLCYFGMTVFCFVWGQRYYPIPYNIRAAIVYITISFALVYIVNAVPIKHAVLAPVFHISVLALFTYLIYKKEKAYLMQSV
ncbi:lipopolysaccharide biosynthesis protein [Chryseotalea sanaruensis]|uniref:lipopolysaccharide biosynthesis protein n=1 Tax=Chryseotalea sanaruensis TaxID=2482724 RepID=UPI000F8F0147|nr:oligosaccharide flippase family protein [Chryseotalea sanaruensis]